MVTEVRQAFNSIGAELIIDTGGDVFEIDVQQADCTPREAGMRLRKAPVRPTWKPTYARGAVRIESWSKFISETYWNVPLEK
jgi:hypothetical protein